MTVLSDLYGVAMLVLVAAALFFIFCRHYEDGLVGNPACFVIGVMALLELLDMGSGDWTRPTVVQMVREIAIAVFLARYAIKVIWKNWQEHGAPAWLRREKRPVRVWP